MNVQCISTTSQMRPCRRSAMFTVAGRPLCDLHVAESARIIGEPADPLTPPDAPSYAVVDLVGLRVKETETK